MAVPSAVKKAVDSRKNALSVVLQEESSEQVPLSHDFRLGPGSRATNVI